MFLGSLIWFRQSGGCGRQFDNHSETQGYLLLLLLRLWRVVRLGRGNS